MDISDTIIPRSNQLNYDDVAASPMTVTISEVKRGDVEQPVQIHLAETPGRPFKPSKSMRRVMVAAWGKDAREYAGRKLTLFGDPNVKWAGQPVGGIRISHMSHLEKPLKVPLTVTRGKREPFVVQPLQDAAPVVTAEMVAACTDPDQLRKWWVHASPDMQTLIQDRAAELDTDGDPR